MKKRDRQEETLHVHLIPYSKAELGWKKTLDEYYSGVNQAVQHASVNSILSSVVEELSDNPDRTFSFAEVKYLQMWYTRQDQKTKDKLKKQIKNGQFEVVSGGWGSADQATPNYEDLIDNIMIGHQFLQKEFNQVPNVGWNLGAFGDSATNARIFA